MSEKGHLQLLGEGLVGGNWFLLKMEAITCKIRKGYTAATNWSYIEAVDRGSGLQEFTELILK